jgi:hypothetical protein
MFAWVEEINRSALLDTIERCYLGLRRRRRDIRQARPSPSIVDPHGRDEGSLRHFRRPVRAFSSSAASSSTFRAISANSWFAWLI